MAKIKASTQSFTEIKEISEDVIILSKGNACLIVELTATNFELLSGEEQDAKILAFSALLNSLSFPIQIVIRSNKLDISSYLKLLDNEASKNTNSKLAGQIVKYREFVANLVKVNTILDKKFYIVIPFNNLEGHSPFAHNLKEAAKTVLHTKAASLNSQLARLNLRARVLKNDDLVRLFYEIYNEEHTQVNAKEQNQL